MKFAVIEYKSKSGKIWKHTPEHPNFIADPDKEVDPTSFGCYVSALEGEHIPLTGLITGDVYNLTPITRIRRKIAKKLLGKWPQDYPLDYLKQFDTLMVVHQISDGHEVTRFTKRLKETFPSTFVLGVATQPFGILEKYWNKHLWWLKDFRIFLDTCDVVITVVEETKEKWQQLTQTPVEYLPQPYPVEYASQYFRPAGSKKKIIFLAGVTDRDSITRGHTAAKLLQNEFSDYQIHVTRTPGASLDVRELTGSRYIIVPFEPWHQHLATLSTYSLVINTDFTLTRGRVQIDCAATGTPSIGANSDGQRDFFPQLAASPETLIDDLVEHGRELITNIYHYEKVVAYARAKLPKYNYANSATRLRELVERYRNTK